MIPSLHFLLFPVVYPKVPYLAHSFSLSIQLLLARWSQKIPSNIICTLMTPSCTSLSLLQLLLSWNTYHHFQWHSLLDELEKTASQSIKNWISSHWHKTTACLKFSDLTNLSLSNDIIPVSSSARNLGFIFDSDMSFSDQINSVSKSCHFHIRDIRRIRHLLPLSTATALANSLVSSKLDYCNSLYSGISQTNLNKLQRIQNSLARVITNTSKYINTSHQHSKNYTGFLSNKESTTKPVFSHTKHLQINNLHIFTIVFHSRHILFLHDLLIRLFFPFHMSDHHLAKGLSLSSVHASGIPLPPDTRNSSSLPIFRSRLKTTPL